jgi:hypothetical protein
MELIEQPAKPVQLTYYQTMRDVMGPFMVDQTIRQAVQHCWLALPESERRIEKVEQEIQRLVRRALEDFKQDMAAFGFPESNA